MAHHHFPWREAFLAALRVMPIVSHACAVVGIERSTAYRARQADKAFAEAWDDAMESGVDSAEQEAFNRGRDGWLEPVISQGRHAVQPVLDKDGQPVIDEATGKPKFELMYVRKKSDALLGLVLKARRAAYRVERTEVTGAEGAPLLTDETARAARLKALLGTAAARQGERDPEDFA